MNTAIDTKEHVSYKLKRSHELTTTSNVQPLVLKRTRMVNLLLVGLANGEVRLYNDKQLVYSLHYRLPVSCFRFGSFGREDCALCLVHSNGALSVNILKRQARLDGPSTTAGTSYQTDMDSV